MAGRQEHDRRAGLKGRMGRSMTDAPAWEEAGIWV